MKSNSRRKVTDDLRMGRMQELYEFDGTLQLNLLSENPNLDAFREYFEATILSSENERFSHAYRLCYDILRRNASEKEG